MKIEVGMWIRSPKGKIEKISSLVVQDNPIFPYTINCTARFRSDIARASYNIIDLIEVGDYVNGYKVLAIWHDNMASEEFNDYVEVLNGKVYEVARRIYPNSIETIVTKQQFESLMYEVK